MLAPEVGSRVVTSAGACPGAEAGRGTPCSQRSSSARCSSPSRSEVPPASSLCAFVYLACPPAASPAPTLRCAAMRLIEQRVRISRAPPCALRAALGFRPALPAGHAVGQAGDEQRNAAHVARFDRHIASIEAGVPVRATRARARITAMSMGAYINTRAHACMRA